LSQKDENNLIPERNLSLEHIERRLDVLDRRLDSIDSIVTVLGERVMKQPLTLEITCPSCGQIVEIGIMGNQKQRG
jgi:hypothetical protein